jgi:hypothetical protein
MKIKEKIKGQLWCISPMKSVTTGPNGSHMSIQIYDTDC